MSQLFGPVPADESTLGGGIQWVMAIENNALSQSSSYIGGVTRRLAVDCCVCWLLLMESVAALEHCTVRGA